MTEQDESRGAMLVGYARVSTVGQDFDSQMSALARLGVDPARIHVDTGFSGESMTQDGLAKAVAACRAGDTLVVPSLDRLAGTALGIVEIIQVLGERGILLSNNGDLFDLQGPQAALFFRMLTAVAEAEGGWNSLRTREAMKRPGVRGNLRGKQPRLTPEQDATLARLFAGPDRDVPAIAARFNISRSGVYRALERNRKRGPADTLNPGPGGLAAGGRGAL